LKIIYALVLVIIVLSAMAVFAQEIAPVIPDTSKIEATSDQPAIVQPAATIPPPPLPTITPDYSIFKRTPVIDGQIEQGEWDQYYCFEYNGIQSWVYVNWDSNNLYVASKSTAPTDLLITLDGNNDGWFHGADNYELVARRGQSDDGITLSVSHYESQRMSGTSGAPLTAAEAAAFTMKAGSGPNSYIYEIAIPKDSVPGIEFKPGKKVGLKVAVGTGTQEVIWVPTAPLGEVQTAELVALKSSNSSPLNLDIKIRDLRVAPGEELFAKIVVKNNGDVESPADTMVIGGEGKTARLLGSQLVRIEGIKPGKTFSTIFRTPIPRSANPGSGALGVEVRTGTDRIVGSLMSFDIVPPYEVKLDIRNGLDKDGYQRVSVIITNNTLHDIFGKVKLSLPEGWTFRWSEATKEFRLRPEESQQAVVYRVKPTEKQDKKTPVLAEVQIGNQTLSVSGVIEITNSSRLK
jgi:hypothetical protein